MRPVPSLSDTKSAIRHRIRQRRAALNDTERRRLDGAINDHLLDFVGRLQPRTVAAYLAFDGEPDLAPAMMVLERQGVSLAVPVLSASAGRDEIRFRQWSGNIPTQPNRYGIREPQGSAELPIGELDLALIPLVGWDTTGGRLGMGASYYDRLFQPFAQGDRPLRVGVGYRVQQLESVPIEPWDIRLHWMLTDDGCIDCREQHR